MSNTQQHIIMLLTSNTYKMMSRGATVRLKQAHVAARITGAGRE